MAVSYKRLWKLIIDKDMTNVEVRKVAHIGPSTFSKMKKNQYVTLEVLDKICKVLECEIGDIVERVPDGKKKTNKVDEKNVNGIL